ncbi:MAG: hypothetical protein WAM60_24945 [Candidatus Promineifilaceae bacterium]
MIIRNRLIAGALAGLVGGVVAAVLAKPEIGIVAHLLVSLVLGALFGLGLGSRLDTAGSSLMWGQAFGLLWWLIGPLSLLPLLYGEGLLWTVTDIQTNFALLPANLVGFGAVWGLGSFVIGRFLPLNSTTTEVKGLVAPELVPSWGQALIVGGLGGLLGSWVFLRGIETANFFPLVASIIGMDTYMAGVLLHYIIGIIIAITFALLFNQDIRGAGSALVWGLSYGILWWVIGPLTLLPLLTGAPVTWSLEAAQANFASLVAHLLYGAMVGWFYAVINGIWRTLFIDSDPLNRTREGRGVANVRGLLMGQMGGILGGLLFTFVMIGIGALPYVANLVGSRSPAVGWLVHLIISIIIGSSFGLLFQHEAYSYGAGMSWGVLYGVLWWLLGALTLFPALLRQPIDWSLGAATANYAPLIGHLLYGLGLGLLYQYLARRHDPALQTRRERARGTVAAAMWASTLFIVVMLPLLLSS